MSRHRGSSCLTCASARCAGIMEDAGNRGRLAKLLRFHTSASPDTLTSLDDYLGRMKEGQKSIFFICGGSMDEVQRSPFLEQLLAKGYEVILFTEPMDEYMMQARLAFVSVSCVCLPAATRRCCWRRNRDGSAAAR
jgi:HSP90 family molecular chaperone